MASTEKYRKRQNQIQFRAPQDIEAALVERAGAAHMERNSIAVRDLGRYYALIVHELANVELTEPEAMLIIDALNGCLAAEPPELAALLGDSIAEAIAIDSLDEKWSIDGPALVAKLNGLSLAQCLALIDAVERVWLYLNELSRDEALKRVGLT